MKNIYNNMINNYNVLSSTQIWNWTVDCELQHRTTLLHQLCVKSDERGYPCENNYANITKKKSCRNRKYSSLKDLLAYFNDWIWTFTKHTVAVYDKITKK